LLVLPYLQLFWEIAPTMNNKKIIKLVKKGIFSAWKKQHNIYCILHLILLKKWKMKLESPLQAPYEMALYCILSTFKEKNVDTILLTTLV